jgi:hypothetical protein
MAATGIFGSHAAAGTELYKKEDLILVGGEGFSWALVEGAFNRSGHGLNLSVGGWIANTSGGRNSRPHHLILLYVYICLQTVASCVPNTDFSGNGG